MDTKFQTSFIPKKVLSRGVATARPESVSVFFLIALIVFILTLAAGGGVYAYKKLLITRIEKMNVSLSQAKNSFKPESIKTWNRLNQRIISAEKIIQAHSVASPVFDLLENVTLATVKFETFNYSLKDSGSVLLSMTGKARNFGSVALQSDIIGREASVKNPVFSDLNPDQTGSIVFKFSGLLDPSLVSYKNSLTPSIELDNN